MTMKKKSTPRLESVLTLAATVAALGTAVGVAPRDLLAAETTGALQTEKTGAGQAKLLSPLNQHKIDASQHKATMPGSAASLKGPAAAQHKLQPDAAQIKSGMGAQQHKMAVTPAASNIKQRMNLIEGN
jgi:hypothetical protein